MIPKTDPKLIACIGSRELNDSQLALCEAIGTYLVSHGYTISTGAGDGADQAFAAGGSAVDPSKVELHLPWRGFNSHSYCPGNQLYIEGYRQDFMSMAAVCHPAWGNLSMGARRLMARNVGIVMGTAVVIAWPLWKGSNAGGTGQGMRIAQEILHIPVRDISNTEVRTKLCADMGIKEL